MHVIQRGHNRSSCFRGKEDFYLYRQYLIEFASRFNCSIHAYVLMTNHVHLLLTPRGTDGCSQLMRFVNQQYVRYFNRRYERSGTLWEGRFHSCITQSEAYVLRCYRYIELNPVRARMALTPLDYLWSSYAGNAMGSRDELLTPQEQYFALGQTASDRHSVYRSLFDELLSSQSIHEIRVATNSNSTLGNTEFKRQYEKQKKPGTDSESVPI